MIAGVWDPSGGNPERRRANVERALAGEAFTRSAIAGPLVLAWSGAQYDGGTADAGCVTEGRVTNLATLPGGDLAEAYARLGDGLPERLRGDFVLVCWDRGGGRLLLARDHLGGRALFLHQAGRTLSFASEIKLLLRLLSRRPAPDGVAVASWLAGVDPRDGRTLHEGVVALPAAHLLLLDGGELRRRRFWSPRYEGTLEVPEAELPATLRAGLTGAVSRAASPGERAGVLLSGGLDSSTVASLATRELPEEDRPAAFSAVFPGRPSMDESSLIETVTTRLGLNSVRMTVGTPSLLAGALEHLREWELPLYSHNDAFWVPLFRRAAADGVDVMLDGEGGDLLFGTPRALIADRLRHLRAGSALALVRRVPGAGDSPSRDDVLRILRQEGIKGALPYRLHELLRQLRARRGVPGWLSPATARLLLADEDPLAWKRLDGPLWWRRIADAVTVGLDSLQAKSHLRRRAAAAGLQARHPFLDLDLVELALRLPPELAFDPHLDRPLLRRSMAGLVPDPILRRRDKSRFDEILLRGLAGKDLAAIRRLLGPEAEVYAFVDREAAGRELLDGPPARHPRGRLYWAAGVWRLATAECWLRFQADPASLDQLLDGLGNGARPLGEALTA